MKSFLKIRQQMGMLCVCFLIVIIPKVSTAAPVIEDSSAGIFVVTSKQDSKMAAIISIAGVKKEESKNYKAKVLFPDGKEYELSRTGFFENRLFFHLAGVAAKDVAAFLGDYVFSLLDEERHVLDTFTDFFVFYKDDLYEGMGTFETDSVNPKDGEVLEGTAVSFKWNAVKGASVYRLRVCRDKIYNVKDIVVTESTKETGLVVPYEKLGKGVFCYRLDAIHEEGDDIDNIVRYTVNEERFPVFEVK